MLIIERRKEGERERCDVDSKHTGRDVGSGVGISTGKEGKGERDEEEGDMCRLKGVINERTGRRSDSHGLSLCCTRLLLLFDRSVSDAAGRVSVGLLQGAAALVPTGASARQRPGGPRLPQRRSRAGS